MKKSTLPIFAVTLMLSACGLLNQSGTSESTAMFEDGIYSSAPTFRSKDDKQSSDKTVVDLVERTKSSGIYRSAEQKESVPAPSVSGYTYDQTNYSPYVPYSIGSSWYWSRHYDPWYYYPGYGGWYNPWYYGYTGWHDPWYYGYSGLYGWYGGWYGGWHDPWHWYMSPYYCGWYGGWDPYWHHHHYYPYHGIAGSGKDVWYGSRKSVTGSRTGTGRVTAGSTSIGRTSTSRVSTVRAAVNRTSVSRTAANRTAANRAAATN